MAMRIIFHVPYELEFTNPKGGGVRPVKMLRAFEKLGDVTLIHGRAAQRKQGIEAVTKRLAGGERWDLCYSESSTMPTLLTEPHHLPTHPLLDFGFFARLRRAAIPVGLFYRDIQWRFPIYGQGLDPARKALALAMYRFDLLAYGRTVDVLFLPSLPMADHVPLPRRPRRVALPPGHDIEQVPAAPTDPGRLALFYVGGLTDNYRLGAFLEAVKNSPGVHLTLCCRPAEWAAVKAEYAPLIADNVDIVHAASEELAPLFARAQVGVLATEPQPYWTFAAPLKLYEYLGNGLPVIAADGSLSGDFVADKQVGWTRPYSSTAYTELLADLVADPALVSAARDRVLVEREQHSWTARAEQAAAELLAAAGPRSAPSTTKS